MVKFQKEQRLAAMHPIKQDPPHQMSGRSECHQPSNCPLRGRLFALRLCVLSLTAGAPTASAGMARVLVPDKRSGLRQEGTSVEDAKAKQDRQTATIFRPYYKVHRRKRFPPRTLCRKRRRVPLQSRSAGSQRQQNAKRNSEGAQANAPAAPPHGAAGLSLLPA